MKAIKEEVILKLEKKADSLGSQRKVMFLTISGFLFFSVFYLSQTNPSKIESINNAGRVIASVDGKSIYPTDTSYEKGVVNSLNKMILDESSIGQLPSRMDQFVFGELKGYYQVESHLGKITGLKFNTGYLGYKPIAVEKVDEFLEKNKEVFSKNFSKVQLLEKKDDSQTYNLLNPNNEIIGQVTATLDQSGALTELKF